MTKLTRFSFGLALLLVLSSTITPASAQVTCIASVSVAPILRGDGLADPVGDYLLDCTGGLSTPPGLPVPQVNISIFLNTNITSKITASIVSGNYSEALLLVDEPNTPTTFMWPNGRPLLNCGQTGAPDNGPSGPGVCEIVSNGDPTATYDGSQNTFGIATCDGSVSRPAANSYSCGRPNAFQGRVGTLFSPTQLNAITFVGVPFDPPGLGHRHIRITNLRANGNALGVSMTFMATQVQATIAISGPIAMSIGFVTQVVGYVNNGMVPGGCGTPAASTVRLCEGFASSWKTKNLSFFVGDNIVTSGNAIPGSFTYSGTTNYPADIAQNVPGWFSDTLTESLFEWQDNITHGPPPINPPLGFGSPGTVPNLGYPLGSGGYAIFPTNPSLDGVATAGTRLALQFSGVPGGASIQVPLTVNLFHTGCSPCTPTGVLKLTNSDAAGVGPFNPAASTTLGASNMAVYEVLYADPFGIDYADVPYTVFGGPSAGVTVSPSFAPFYSDPASGQPSLTGFLPRFAPPSITSLMGVIAGMNLPNGTANSLNAKLNAALADIAANNLAGACGSLTALINEANAQSGKKLTVAQANTIIAMAIQLKAQLGC